MITQESIEKILSAVRIDEVVSDFVSLKRHGGNLRGLCPFHQEKTPSFFVSPSKEIYKCFGCGASGNAVRFLMEHEKYTYPETLKYLARKYNVTVDESFSEENKKEKDEIASIYIVLAFAQEFYHQYLTESNEGKSIGAEYLKQRGITDQSVKQFGLGLSPSAKDMFTAAALKKGYEEKFLTESGLSLKTNEGKLIDRFRERIMFPIFSITGRVLGFGGRVMGSSTNEAKYINSPETPIFSKGKILFGLNLAKNNIQRNDKCYLAEGYTDVIALHQAGIDNVVASLGTSLTEDHTRLIKRYTNNLTFIFDGDEAGIKASIRGIDIALKEEMNVRVIALPEGEDPDSFTQKNNASDLKLYLKKNDIDFLIFKTKFLFGEKQDDPVKKAEIVRNLIKSIIQIPNHISRSNYVKELSFELDIEEEILYRELNNQLASQSKSAKVGKDPKTQSESSPKQFDQHLKSTVSEQEKNMIKLLIIAGNTNINENRKCADLIFDTIKDTSWEIDSLGKIFQYYFTYRQEKKEYPEIKHFLHHPEPLFQEIASEVSFIDMGISENWSKKTGRDIPQNFNFIKEISYSLKHFELRKLQSMLKDNVKNLRQKDLSNEEEAHYQKIHQVLLSHISTLSKELGIAYY